MKTADIEVENSRFFKEIYKKYFPMVQRFVLKNSGNTDDAKDLFQETMLVLLQKLRQDNFVLTATLKTYTMAIAKNLWLKNYRTSKPQFSLHELEEEDDFFAQIDVSIEKEQSYWNKFEYYFQKMTNHCKSLIHDWFFSGLSSEDIRIKYGYTTKHNAQNQKHKCLNQIRKEYKKEN